MISKIISIGSYVLIALMFGIPLYLYGAHKLGFKYRKKLFSTRRIIEQSQEVPMNGNLFAATFVYHNQYRVFYEDYQRQLPGTIFLRWILDGQVEVQRLTPARDEITRFILKENPRIEDPLEKSFYEHSLEAAGDDHILEENDLSRWRYFHPQVDLYGSDPEKHGRSWFTKRHYQVGDSIFLPRLNEKGAREARRLVELENYLNALVEGKGKEPVKADRINDLLVYSILFKNSDKVCEVLKNLLPEKMPETVAYCKKMGEALWEAHNEATDAD